MRDLPAALAWHGLQPPYARRQTRGQHARFFAFVAVGMTEDIWVKGYVYSVDVAEEPAGKYRGQIFVKSHRYSGRTFEPPVVIETPAAFKREHAAEIEARALARELIDSGNLEDRLRTVSPSAANAAPPQTTH